MKLVQGKKYRIKEGHRHAGRILVFQFMGGPTRDVVVLIPPEDVGKYRKEHFAVKIEDVEELQNP